MSLKKNVNKLKSHSNERRSKAMHESIVNKSLKDSKNLTIYIPHFM